MMPLTCQHCGHELQYDARLHAWTCFCGVQVFENVHEVKHYACQVCGKELIAIKAKRRICNTCLNAARRKRWRQKHQAVATA